MKKIIKKATSILLSLLMVTTAVSALPFTASATVVTEESVGTGSGETGDCTWTLDNEGTLTISGNGEMENYKTRNSSPWGKTVNNVIINNGVTNIGNYAFCECENLTGVTISDSVTSIGRYSFAECSSLTNISIPDSVTTIDNNAFEDCSELTTITIPDSVTSIGFWAFEYCKKLTAITIPDSVTIIRSFSFMGCPNLTIYGKKGSYAETYAKSNNILFEALKNIIASGETGDCSWTLDDEGTLTISGNGAMEDYYPKGNIAIPWRVRRFSEVIIKQGVTHIGVCAFCDCEDLTRITIPESVTSIGTMAFFMCTNLTSINIPYGVVSIEGGAFAICTNLSSIIIPNGETSIGDRAFMSCPNLTIYGKEGSYAETYANSNNNHFVALKDIIARGETGDCTWTLDDKGTLTISGNGAMGNYSFGKGVPWKSYEFSEVNIENGVTSIGNYAFYECENLTEINIPESVTSIGKCSFGKCVKLDNITLPDSVSNIGDEAFYQCKSLSSIKIPFGVTCINALTFAFCSNLEEIILPKSISTIRYCAFEYCSNLTAITIPNSVTSIEYMAFDECKGLKEIIIPESVSSLGYSAFSNCENIEKVDMSECSVNILNECVFFQCIKLESIKLSKDLTYIEEKSFSGDKNLKAVSIPDRVTGIGRYAFEKCINLFFITIPDSVTEIGDYAFYNCVALKSINIPPSVETIGEKAFGYYNYNENIEDKVNGFTIYGRDGSNANTYATNNVLNFEPKTFKYIFGFINDKNIAPSYIDNYTKDYIKEFFSNLDMDFTDLNAPVGSLMESRDGSCFGIAVALLLYNQGLLNFYKDSTESEEPIDLSENDKIGSNINIITLITFLQALQDINYYAKKISCAENAVKNNSKIQSDIISVLDSELTKYNRCVLIGYSFKVENETTKQHAVLGYGIQSGEEYLNSNDYNPDSNPDSKVKFNSGEKMWSYNDKEYNKRILIADPNFRTLNDDACIYYNSSDQSWICPCRNQNGERCYWNNNSESNTGTDSEFNTDTGKIQFIMRLNNLDDVECYPFISSLTIDNSNGLEINKYTEPGTANFGNTQTDSSITPNSNDDGIGLKSFYLQDSKAAYMISYENNSTFNMIMDYEKVSYYANVENAKSALVKPEGSISIEGSDIKYDLTMLTDDSERVNSWYSLEVLGDNAKNVTLTKCDDGYLLKADTPKADTPKADTPLKTITITAKSDKYEKTRRLSTIYDSVFIYETDDNNIGVNALGDVNLDGYVDINDATLLQRYLAMFEQFSPTQLSVADISADGAVTISDVTIIQRKIAKMPY